jgi:hypothetical protein
VAEGRPANTVASCSAIGSQSSVRDKNRQASVAYCDGTTIEAFVNVLIQRFGSLLGQAHKTMWQWMGL